jgi:hypothetical protein
MISRRHFWKFYEFVWLSIKFGRISGKSNPVFCWISGKSNLVSGWISKRPDYPAGYPEHTYIQHTCEMKQSARGPERPLTVVSSKLSTGSICVMSMDVCGMVCGMKQSARVPERPPAVARPAFPTFPFEKRETV